MLRVDTPNAEVNSLE